jgi:hypothetical protein
MRIRAVFAMVLAAAVAGGCGPADVPLSRAEARAIAHAISLAQSDLPDHRAIAHRETPSDRRASARTDRCAGLTRRSEALAAVASADFVKPAAGRSVTARVWVMRSSAIAGREVAVADGRVAIECYRREAASRPGDDPVSVSVAALRSPLAVGSGVRLVTRGLLGGRHSRLFADQFVFNVGPVEVLTVFASLNRAPDRAEERRVLAMLFSRASRTVP